MTLTRERSKKDLDWLKDFVSFTRGLCNLVTTLEDANFTLGIVFG